MFIRTLLAKLIEDPPFQKDNLSLCYDHLNYMFWFNLPLCLENQNLLQQKNPPKVRDVI